MLSSFVVPPIHVPDLIQAARNRAPARTTCRDPVPAGSCIVQEDDPVEVCAGISADVRTPRGSPERMGYSRWRGVEGVEGDGDRNRWPPARVGGRRAGAARPDGDLRPAAPAPDDPDSDQRGARPAGRPAGQPRPLLGGRPRPPAPLPAPGPPPRAP